MGLISVIFYALHCDLKHDRHFIRQPFTCAGGLVARSSRAWWIVAGQVGPRTKTKKKQNEKKTKKKKKQP